MAKLNKLIINVDLLALLCLYERKDKFIEFNIMLSFDYRH